MLPLTDIKAGPNPAFRFCDGHQHQVASDTVARPQIPNAGVRSPLKHSVGPQQEVNPCTPSISEAGLSILVTALSFLARFFPPTAPVPGRRLSPSTSQSQRQPVSARLPRPWPTM